MISWTPSILRTAATAWVALATTSAPAFAQQTPPPPEDRRPAPERPVSYGLEIQFSSGHADRGIVISDRPVVEPVTWISGSFATFSVWSSLTLAATADGSRPQILGMELTRAHQWSNLTIEPAVRAWFYRDPVGVYGSRSVEGWLYLSYDAGPVSLFTSQSVDVVTYRGAYFGQAGVELDRRLSQRIDIEGSIYAGWASSTFNDAYIGIRKSAFNLIGVQSWLTAHVTPHLYIRPYCQFNTIMNRALRAELAQPSLLIGLATGVEF